MKKYLFPIVTIIICFAVVGTTFAWLVDKTDPIVNTFTVGDVEITLTETKGEGTASARSFKMVPGKTIPKDPKVEVLADSEACWLFVKIEETNNTFATDKKFVTYAVGTNVEGKTWTLLQTEGNVSIYYIPVDATTAAAGVTYSVLNGDKVVINPEATADVLENAETLNPTLTFTAYAVQSEGVASAAAAWNVATTGNLPTT